jgi:energy-coupling factor transporter ATP-binding protein EcfA2
MIIFLNGSINSGKSTIAKLLAKAMPNTATVEIDALREMIEWMPIDQAVPINLENAIAVIRNFTKHDISCIVPYPLSQRNYELVTSGLSDLDVPMFFFTLAPSIETTLSDRGKRKLDDEERKRIKHHYAIGIHTPSFGTIIDNSRQTPEETAQEILRNIS